MNVYDHGNSFPKSAFITKITETADLSSWELRKSGLRVQEPT